MNVNDLINQMTPDIVGNLKTAIELGKWPNGEKLTPEQREHCMQAVIAWELKNLPPEQRTGYVPPKNHDHCGGEGEVAEPEDKPLKWH